MLQSFYVLRYMRFHSTGGQACVQNVNIHRIGDDYMTRRRLGIVPNLHFHCNARITRIRVRLLPDPNRYDYPYIQVWRPTSKDSTIYTKIAQVQVTKSQITSSTYVEANIPLFGTNRIVVESGDVIGYYHPYDAGYKVRTIRTNGFILYEFENIDGSTATSVDLNYKYNQFGLHQPLIQFTIGKFMSLLKKLIPLLLYHSRSKLKYLSYWHKFAGKAHVIS